MNLLVALLAMVIGYLAGSVSFARLVARRFAPQQDITKIVVEGTDGEGRFESDAVSATSVRLHLGPGYGCLVGVLDILKATMPALLFKLWMPEAPYYLLAAGLAVVGHNWPIYYRFQGGRGISPSMGGMLVVDWLGVVVTNLLGLASDLVIRNPLLSSGVWLGLMVPWIWLGPHGWPERIYSVAVVIIYSVSMLPDWQQMLHLKRRGELEKLQLATEVRVRSRLDQGVAQQRSVADLLGELVSRLRGKDGES
ncbi:MAG: glycerol-3-phosphate acyltransferase [Anaerolineae bacterium]|nr:glycerol-3-phosphate acyltransferase [Anaerolineae bacterium]